MSDVRDGSSASASSSAYVTYATPVTEAATEDTEETPVSAFAELESSINYSQNLSLGTMMAFLPMQMKFGDDPAFVSVGLYQLDTNCRGLSAGRVAPKNEFTSRSHGEKFLSNHNLLNSGAVSYIFGYNPHRFVEVSSTSYRENCFAEEKLSVDESTTDAGLSVEINSRDLNLFASRSKRQASDQRLREMLLLHRLANFEYFAPSGKEQNGSLEEMEKKIHFSVSQRVEDPPILAIAVVHRTLENLVTHAKQRHQITNNNWTWTPLREMACGIDPGGFQKFLQWLEVPNGVVRKSARDAILSIVCSAGTTHPLTTREMMAKFDSLLTEHFYSLLTHEDQCVACLFLRAVMELFVKDAEDASDARDAGESAAPAAPAAPTQPPEAVPAAPAAASRSADDNNPWFGVFGLDLDLDLNLDLDFDLEVSPSDQSEQIIQGLVEKFHRFCSRSSGSWKDLLQKDRQDPNRLWPMLRVNRYVSSMTCLGVSFLDHTDLYVAAFVRYGNMSLKSQYFVSTAEFSYDAEEGMPWQAGRWDPHAVDGSFLKALRERLFARPRVEVRSAYPYAPTGRHSLLPYSEGVVSDARSMSEKISEDNLEKKRKIEVSFR